MSPAVAPILINPLPIFNQYPKFNHIHLKTPFLTPAFPTYKGSALVYRKSVRLEKTMAAGSIESGIVGGGDAERLSPQVSAFEQEALVGNDGGSFHQTVGGLHAFCNRLSKWIVAVIMGALVLLRHDALALWGVMGSVLNVILSVTLKQILKQERPVSGVSSGHGMPSSHAQSIFFAVVFIILSVVQWLGLNGVSVILSVLIVSLGSYFSWLRVLLRYHTTSQVVVGSCVGSIFAIFYFWAWESIVHKAYDSSLWVRVILLVGAACFCLAFISHVIQHWLKDEDP